MKDDDTTLLSRFVREGAEDAFTGLVERHLNLVWGAARRITRDDHLARDVAQTVFSDLARKAKSLPGETILPGWLHRAACHAAHNAVRAKLRRTERERLAIMTTSDGSDVDFEALAPLLDDALAALTPADRDAILLRFFSGLSFGEIGKALGTNDDTAQKRTSRALDRLREHFGRQGHALSGQGLALALATAAAQAAPAGIAGLVAHSALTATAGATGASWLASLKLPLALAGSGVAVLILVPWTKSPATTNTVPATTVAAAPASPPAAVESEFAEIVRLRNELARLRPNSPAWTPPVGALSTSLYVNRSELLQLRGLVASALREERLRASLPVPVKGQIRGRVALLGSPPPEREIEAVLQDTNARRLHEHAPFTQNYQVSADGGLGGVFVHLKSGWEGMAFAVPTNQPVIATSGTLFYPNVLAVMAGQSFQISNRDPLMHNLNTAPKLNEGFNVALAGEGQCAVKAFANPEPFIRLACNVHPWELGYVCVSATPFFTVTEANGHFTLPAGLPDGVYEVEALHRRAGSQSAWVRFRREEAPLLAFELTVPATP